MKLIDYQDEREQTVENHLGKYGMQSLSVYTYEQALANSKLL